MSSAQVASTLDENPPSSVIGGLPAPPRRGLHLLLGHRMCEFPSILRRVSDYSGVACDLVGRTVRLSFVGAVHESVILDEGPHSVTLMLPCGVDVTVPRDEIGPLIRSQGRDPNPHAVGQIRTEWISAVTEGPRVPPTEAMLLLDPSGVGDDDSDFAAVGGRKLDLRRWRGRFGSTHVRVRCFMDGETLANPSRPPAVVYCKLSLPYVTKLLGGIDNSGDEHHRRAAEYSRESAAYQILCECQPAVAPTCHHSHYHEATGSYAAVMDDYVGYTHWIGTVSETRRHRHTGDLETVYEETLPGAIRVGRALAALHGRFVAPTSANAVDPALVATSEPRRMLRSAMVHEQVFERAWLRGVSDDDFRDYISAAFGNPPAEAADEEEDAAAVAAEPAPPAIESGAATPTPASARGAGGDAITNNADAPPSSSRGAESPAEVAVSSLGAGSRRHSAASTTTMSVATTSKKGRRGAAAVARHPLPTDLNGGSKYSRLTLIHGDVQCAHVLMREDPKAVPSVLFVDWKRSGIAPFEVDLLQLFLTLPPPTRVAEMRRVLEVYADELSVLYPSAPVYTVNEYLSFMRDTCLVLAIGGPSPWNGDGARCDELMVAHRELLKVARPPPPSAAEQQQRDNRRRASASAASVSVVDPTTA